MGGPDKGRRRRKSGCLLPSGRSEGAAEVAATSPAAAVPGGSSARGCSAPTGTRAPGRAGGRRGWGAVGGARRPSRSPQVDAVRSRPRRALSPAAALRARLSPARLASPLPSPARVLAGKPPGGWGSERLPHTTAGKAPGTALWEATTSAPHRSSSLCSYYLPSARSESSPTSHPRSPDISPQGTWLRMPPENDLEDMHFCESCTVLLLGMSRSMSLHLRGQPSTVQLVGPATPQISGSP